MNPLVSITTYASQETSLFSETILSSKYAKITAVVLAIISVMTTLYILYQYNQSPLNQQLPLQKPPLIDLASTEAQEKKESRLTTAEYQEAFSKQQLEVLTKMLEEKSDAPEVKRQLIREMAQEMLLDRAEEIEKVRADLAILQAAPKAHRAKLEEIDEYKLAPKSLSQANKGVMTIEELA